MQNSSMDAMNATEQKTLGDTLFGYQAIFGFDYWLREHISMEVKGRWISFYSFRDGGIWDQPQSDEDATYRLKTEDLDMFGVTMSLKYHF